MPTAKDVLNNSSSSPVASLDLNLASDNLPIALQKDIHSTCYPHPLYAFLSYDCLSPQHYTFVSSLYFISIPKTIGEELAHPDWCQAMIDDMFSLHSNSTWDLVSDPLGKSVVGCR